MLTKTHPQQVESALRRAILDAHTMTPELLSAIVGHACKRLSLLNRGSAPVDRLRDLLSAGAAVEALLDLVAIETPNWRVRRIALDDGEWYCMLSRNPELPIELSDAVEAHHLSLPCAIALALMEAQAEGVQIPSDVRAPKAAPTSMHVVCCDNFA
jgi:hypothetical protein